MRRVATLIKSTPDKEFDTHEFIRIFAKRFEQDYIDFLYTSPQKTFHAVHAQIGRFLADNHVELNITSKGRKSTKNIFGLNTDNELWGKTTD